MATIEAENITYVIGPEDGAPEAAQFDNGMASIFRIASDKLDTKYGITILLWTKVDTVDSVMVLANYDGGLSIQIAPSTDGADLYFIPINSLLQRAEFRGFPLGTWVQVIRTLYHCYLFLFKRC